ncbi:hypothetical protein BHM03_00042601 [Ensete ventricosum]|nr:hypothetical protein BHM03_00042601 [Ensete ventricosum]
MSLIRWICSRLLDQVIPCPQVTLARWQSPCQGATTPVTSATAPAGNKAGRRRQPLASALSSPLQATVPRLCLRAAAAPAGWPQLDVPAGWPQLDVPAGGCCPLEWCFSTQAPPLRAAAPTGAAGLPFGLALAAASRRPFVWGLGCGLAVGGRPCMGAGHGWPPLLLVALQAAATAAGWPPPDVPTGDSCPRKRCFSAQAPPLRAAAPMCGYRPLRAPLASLSGWP